MTIAAIGLGRMRANIAEGAHEFATAGLGNEASVGTP